HLSPVVASSQFRRPHQRVSAVPRSPARARQCAVAAIRLSQRQPGRAGGRAMNSAIRVVPYRPVWYSSYQALAEREWGSGCHQPDPGYLRWMHENPIAPPSGQNTIWLGVAGETVIGCITSMRLRWRVGEQLVDFPTLHDWLVAPESRTGLGTM